MRADILQHDFRRRDEESRVLRKRRLAQTRFYDQPRIGGGWLIPIRIECDAIAALVVIDRKKAKSRRVSAPFIVIEKRPMQISDEGNALGADSIDLVNVQAKELAARHPVAPRLLRFPAPASHGQSVLSDQ